MMSLIMIAMTSIKSGQCIPKIEERAIEMFSNGKTIFWKIMELSYSVRDEKNQNATENSSRPVINPSIVNCKLTPSASSVSLSSLYGTKVSEWLINKCSVLNGNLLTLFYHENIMIEKEERRIQ
ncbi:hypothetical protein LOAG_08917 [Loa loa]|uniref:Uncharacterized protein n=1 Tax=Loa loa TaxID=7209 RepID=A0A1S0TT15_LOALO|nr:hypothetical protein LOAG_08917 [Loa loa]EFO19577.1 hypothetical protein LOAG_08917 [Loa loa]